jgi:predicted AAA+ superfamily ATPase
LGRELDALPAGSTVIIDEVQKIPELLDEVHRLIEGKKFRFVLSGSSARKLKRGGADMLAGRARLKSMYPLVSAEIGFDLDVPRILRNGTLPIAVTGNDPAEYLRAYAGVYLQEEIKSEALTRNFGNFSRFLEVAARQNAQVTNVSGISRDAMVLRQTVAGYFDILVDTLMGHWVMPWKLKRSTRQVAHPKFFFFDTGVARALSGRLPYDPSPEETGPLFETFLLNEVRAYLDYSGLNYPFFFWSSPDGVEVDLLCETNRGFIAAEFKSSGSWDARFNRGMKRLAEEMGAGKVDCLGVYNGLNPLKFDGVPVHPAADFLKALWSGGIIR